MDTQEKLPITRKTAIYKAISLLERQGNRREEIVILQELATGMPILQWSEKVAKDCIDNFYLDNGRLPTVTDLQKKNTGLPAHTNFKYLFGVTASQWLSQHSQSYEPPKTTRKRTLLLALEMLSGEERQRIKEMLDEYPLAKWNETNTVDCFLTFYQKYNRVPSEREMEASEELPYYKIFQYRWKMTYLKWLEKYIPILYKAFFDERVYQRDYISDFISEYKRLQPRNEADFDRRRNQEVCCQASHIKMALKITKWTQLVKYCGLELFDIESERIAKEKAKIKSVRIISVDCGENLFFREFSKELEKEVAATSE